jgi:ABC-type nitrate/sulfonate/bicarbonate transport system substrate-binding protein
MCLVSLLKIAVFSCDNHFCSLANFRSLFKQFYLFKLKNVCLTLFFGLVTAQTAFAAPPVQPLEKVKLQLKWKHQFQFAGFYAAKEQGFYAQEGLDVELLERTHDQDVVKQVTSGQVDFAIADCGILTHYSRGEPIVALAAIFQHSPLVFIAKQSSGIISPYEMGGKRIMLDTLGNGDTPLRALLAEVKQDYHLIPNSLNKDDLLNDKVDVLAAYLSNEIFYYQQKGIKINVINPQNYGIDFYGDILFTSQHQISLHPARVDSFHRASLKGWQYALDHTEEMIQLIKKKYHSQSSVKQLRFEAKVLRQQMVADIIPLGTLDVRRLQRISEVYVRLNLGRLLSEDELSQFIYHSQSLTLTEQEKAWLKAHPVIRVGIDKDFPPYEWVDSNGKYDGLIADYLAEFEKMLGVKFSIIKDKSWAEILNMAEQGQLDMISAAVETAQRQRFLTFTPPYISSSVILVAQQQTGLIPSLSRLNGKKVIVEKGYFMQELLQRDYPQIQLILADNLKQALLKLNAGEAEAYVGDSTSVNYAIRELELENLRFAGTTAYNSSHGVAVIKQHPELAAIMQKAIAAMPLPEKERIKNNWLTD